MQKPKVALSMIMKDEAKVLPRLLKSVLTVVDGYYIVDTGSSDNSIQIVKDFFDKHGIQGEIIVDTTCVETIDGKTLFIYDKARNKALELIKGKADYGFFIDCDEELIISPSFNKEKFLEDLSKIDLGSIIVQGSVKYNRQCLFKVSKPFRWVGKIHEVLVCDEDMKTGFIDHLTSFIHHDETDTNPEKYKNHALVLQKAVNENNSPRDIFYLANSYRNAGDNENAIEYYRKRVNDFTDFEGFYEERYESQFGIGNIYWTTGKPFQETIIEYLKCSELDSVRVEHLFNVIIILQNNNLWHSAYLISKSAVERFHKKSPRAIRELFVYENIYEQRLLDVHIMNCRRLGIVEDITKLSDKIDVDDFLKYIPSGWKENKALCEWLVKRINPKNTVELGVDYGYSLICLALNNKGRVYGIDHFKGDSFTGQRNTLSFVQNTINWLRKFNVKNISIIEGDVNYAFKRWNKHTKIDLLHIDCLATYDAIKNDFENWFTHLSNEGVILIHNTSVHEGVIKYFSEIKLPKIECKNGSGLGIVSRNESFINEIKEVFGAFKKEDVKNETSLEIQTETPPETIPNETTKEPAKEPAKEEVVLTPIEENAEREKITIAYINHNEEAFKKYLKPSLDNIKGEFDVLFTSDIEKPATNYNDIISRANTKYILFVHQDVTFGSNFLENIHSTIAHLKTKEGCSDFGALGIVGTDVSGEYIWGKHSEVNEVEKLDCCCILINKEHRLEFDNKTFDDFHLYVEDYCMQSKYRRGRKCWTISTNASEAKKTDAYSLEENYAKHHSVTVNERGYAWGRYWEYHERLKNKWHVNQHVSEIYTSVDVCIISYAKNDELYRVTCEGIESLQKSEMTIKFNIFVVESNKNVNYDQYRNTKTIYPTIPFNYNAYLNIAVKQGDSPYVMLCNNDLTYEKGFATEILKQMLKHPDLLSASPFCPQVHSNDIKKVEVVFGSTVRKELCGWCIFLQRSAYDKIGGLNEEITFWYSDNIYAIQLQTQNVQHALITNSIVNHHENNLGVSGSTILNDKEKQEMMIGQHKNYILAKEKIERKFLAHEK